MEFAASMAFNAVDRITGTLDNMSQGAEQFGRKTPRAFRDAGRSASRFGQIVGGVLSARAMERFAMRGMRSLRGMTLGMMEAGDELAHMSDMIGAGVEEIQGLRFAAESAGIETNTLDSAVERFSRRVGDLRAGSGELLSQLEDLGKEGLVDNLRNADDFSERFAIMADVIGDTEDKADRLRLAQAAFGAQGREMVRMMDGGSASISEMAERFEELGGGMDAKASESAQKFETHMLELRTTLQGFWHQVVGRIIPVVTEVAGEIQDWALENRELIATRAEEFAERFGQAIQDAIPAIRDMADRIVRFVGFLWEYRHIIAAVILAKVSYAAVTGVVSAATGAWSAATAIASKTLIGLSTALKVAKFAAVGFGKVMAVLLSPIVLKIALVAALAAGVYTLIRHWDVVVEFFRNLWNSTVEIFSSAFESIRDWVMDTALVQGMIESWEELRTFFTGLWDGITDAFAAAWDRIQDIAGGIIDVASRIGGVLGGLFGGGDDNGGFQGAQGGMGGGATAPQAPNQRDADARRQTIDVNGHIDVPGGGPGTQIAAAANGAPSVRLDRLGEAD